MTDQAKPLSRPWRRFLRFSVRGLIVIVLVIGGWLGWIVRSARIQREAVATIANYGGTIKYDWKWNGNDIPGGRPRAPRWLVDQIGVDYFGRVSFVSLPIFFVRMPHGHHFVQVEDKPDLVMPHIGHLSALRRLDLTDANVSDTGLASVKGLSSLEILGCMRTRITDAGLAHRKNLPRLSTLELNDNQISDSGLLHLTMLTELSKLGIWKTRVTDAGLAHLRVLTKLNELKLAHTQVTDAGMVYLKGLTNLSVLDLGSTQFTDAGLAHLKGLTNLTELDLSGTLVTDAGMTHLKGLTNLTKFDLSGTQVTDSGMAHLKGLTNLTKLNLTDTHVTDAGAKELQQALPKLNIARWRDAHPAGLKSSLSHRQVSQGPIDRNSLKSRPVGYIMPSEAASTVRLAFCFHPVTNDASASRSECLNSNPSG
jgi:hypothetical protein